MTKDEIYAIRQPLTRPSVRQQIIEHCGTKCVNCGSEVNIQYHHIVPIEMGGSDSLSNTVALCGFCHCLAHGKQIKRADRKKTGRKPKPKPSYADKIIEFYLSGEIGMSAIKSTLDLKGAWKLTDLWYFQEYLTEHHIVRYRNYYDSLLSSRLRENTFNKDVVTVAVVEYDNGEVKEYRYPGKELITHEQEWKKPLIYAMKKRDEA